MRTKRSMTGLMLSACVLSMWCATGCYAVARSDEPLALEAVASYFPISPQDLRLGAGLAFRPNDPIYLRVDAVQSAAGLTLSHRIVLAQTIELSVGLSCYYEMTTHHVRPAVTLARILF